MTVTSEKPVRAPRSWGIVAKVAAGVVVGGMVLLFLMGRALLR